MAKRTLRFEALEDRNLLASSPWHNATREFDVTKDGDYAPDDALEIINYLNAFRAGPIPLVASPDRPFIDVDGDGFITASDALDVINVLNADVEAPAAQFELRQAEVSEGAIFVLGATAPYVGKPINLVLEHDGQPVFDFEPVELAADGEIELEMPRILDPTFNEDAYRLRVKHFRQDEQFGLTVRRGRHPADAVNDSFLQVFGRNPGPINTTYWQARTDLSPTSLLKAMSDAKLEYEASLPKMELYAFHANGEEIPRPSSVAENDPLQARFTNIPPGEKVAVYLVYNGTVAWEPKDPVFAGADGKAVISVTVPTPLLPINFDTEMSGEIDVILAHGDQAEHQTLQLREGPRLLIKSAEVTEGERIYFAVRGVTADEDVFVTIRYSYENNGYRELVEKIGKTNGSNRIEPSPVFLRMETGWLKNGHIEDGIEIDIRCRDHLRGYRATLKKGESRDNIIADLIRNSGTESIEKDLQGLLSEEERILADQLLGDDWEGNAAAIGDALDAFRKSGGAAGGDFLKYSVKGASQALISILLPKVTITGPQWPVLQGLLDLFSDDHGINHHNLIEENKLPKPAKSPTGWYYPLESLTAENAIDRNFGAWGDKYQAGKRHIGEDLFTSLDAPVYAIGAGTILFVSPKGWEYDNVALAIKHSSDQGDFIAIYGHIQTTLTKNSPPIKAGQLIGRVGRFPTLIHLHFGIHPGLSIADPNSLGKVLDPDGSHPEYTNDFVAPLKWINTSKPAG